MIVFQDFWCKDPISRRKVHYCLVILKKKHILTCKAFPYTLSLDTIRAMWYDTKSILNVVARDKGIDSFHGHCLVKKISVGVLITLFFSQYMICSMKGECASSWTILMALGSRFSRLGSQLLLFNEIQWGSHTLRAPVKFFLYAQQTRKAHPCLVKNN